jgi:hypothetical protein
MTRSQRLAFLGIAAAIAVVAVVVLLVASGKDSATVGGAARSTPSSQPSSGGDSTPAKASAAPAPLLKPGDVRKLMFTEGDRIRFRVRVPEADELHVHGYDIERELPAGKTVTVSFKATINGIFEIELHHSDEQIGQLTVEPR